MGEEKPTTEGGEKMTIGWTGLDQQPTTVRRLRNRWGLGDPDELEKEKKKLENKLETEKLRLQEAIEEILPACRSCGGAQLELKYALLGHFHWENQPVGGRQTVPPPSVEVRFLYCEDCGETYFNSRIEALKEIQDRVLGLEQEIQQLGSPFRSC